MPEINFALKMFNIDKNSKFRLKKEPAINLNKIFNSFIKARKQPLPLFNDFRRFGWPNNIISVFVNFQQLRGYIPFKTNFIQLGSRLLILKDGLVKGFFDDDRGWLGIYYNQAQEEPYVTILDIISGTPAEKYGLQKDDKIFGIDNFPIPPFPSKMQSLGYRIWSKLPGDQIVLKIKRDEKVFRKLIKLGYPPLHTGDPIEWLKLYDKFLLVKRHHRLNIIDIRTGKKVWRFPPDFNFYPDDIVIFHIDDKFAYIAISTSLYLKDIDNKDFLKKNKLPYFIKINLKTLQIELLKLLKLRKGSTLHNMFCDEDFCYLIISKGKSKIILPVNTVTGKIKKNIYTNITSDQIRNIQDEYAPFRRYKETFLSGKRTKCIIIDGSIRNDIVNVNSIFCFNKNGRNFSINKHILNLAKKTVIIGYSTTNILFRSRSSDKVYIYNLDTDKIYYSGLNRNVFNIYNDLYHILPNGIVINKDHKDKHSLYITYLKNGRIHKKVIHIPNKERFLGLVNSNEWFAPITIKNKFKRQMCWNDNYMLVSNRYRCPACLGFFNPVINSKQWDNNIIVKVRLYDTQNYNTIDLQQFKLKRTRKLISTLKPFMYLNKIYITSLGRIRGKKEPIIDIYPLSIVAQ